MPMLNWWQRTLCNGPKGLGLVPLCLYALLISLFPEKQWCLQPSQQTKWTPAVFLLSYLLLRNHISVCLGVGVGVEQWGGGPFSTTLPYDQQSHSPPHSVTFSTPFQPPSILIFNFFFGLKWDHTQRNEIQARDWLHIVFQLEVKPSTPFWFDLVQVFELSE